VRWEFQRCDCDPIHENVGTADKVCSINNYLLPAGDVLVERPAIIGTGLSTVKMELALPAVKEEEGMLRPPPDN